MRKVFLDKKLIGDVKVICPICHYSSFLNLEKKRHYGIYEYHYECSHCGLKGPKSFTSKTALKKWNRREKTSTCSFCGHVVKNYICPNCGSDYSNHITSSEEICCCFIDVLGFGHASKVPEDALRIIENFQQIYAGKDIGEMQDFSSFLHFLPFSDSIFICSQHPDSFVQDLAKFIFRSFNLTSYTYEYPEDKKRPEETEIVDINWSEATIKHVKKNWYPAIFRGGIDFGNVTVFSQPSTFYHKMKMQDNLVGASVTSAVRLEELHGFHGARMLCSNIFAQKLSSEIQLKYLNKVTITTDKGMKVFYELLWPIINLQDENLHCGIELVVMNGLSSSINAFLSFYSAYKNDAKLEKVYFNTLKLVFISIKHYMDYHHCSRDEKKNVYRYLYGILKMKKETSIFRDLLWGKYKE